MPKCIDCEYYEKIDKISGNCHLTRSMTDSNYTCDSGIYKNKKYGTKWEEENTPDMYGVPNH
ncbi:hypothetical protein [Anaerovirgula multivorans]|uniref:hypothetical protein n=1 Tax=Anaerovirgula multivorans TaxID=312168 RepID=UPI001131D5C9|nr:hypothetical protein [Anaerovirgula multivorans]